MYLVATKTAITEALRTVFGGAYPDQAYANLNITVEFPMLPSNYPGIWVQFEETDVIRRAGIDHHEVIVDDQGTNREVTRYTFQGNLVMTVAALSSQERDRLFDELVRVFAFSGIDATSAGKFRTLIDHNDLIGLRFDYDELSASGEAATPGTPWDTNEVIYERTLSILVLGEFVLDKLTNTLVTLSHISVQGFDSNETDTGYVLNTIEVQGDEDDPTQWH